MEVLKFDLSGRTAFFKKPEFNTYLYFSYGNIHKVALLGILGAVLGYSGYGKVNEDNKGQLKFTNDKELPEFYTKLNSLNIGIVPNHRKGYIAKKVQTFNNSVGYASKEQGGNLIVREQWLENPSWTIYILLDNEESLKIKDSLMSHKCVYQPYLGKNDHIADITDVSVVSGGMAENINSLDSLFIEKNAIFDDIDDESEELPFVYRESLPIGLDDKTFMYKLDRMVFTNNLLKEYMGTIYKVQDEKATRTIAFY